MNQQTSEQEWQQMQFRINALMTRFLKNDVPAIEHKSSIIGLLQAPAEYMHGGEMENAK